MWLSQKGTRKNYRKAYLHLARKGYEIIIEMRKIIVKRILAKIKSRVIALAAWCKILKQVNFCETSELMPPFCHNVFQHIHLF